MEQLSYYKKETKEFVCTTSFFETEEMNSTTTIYNGNFVKPIFDNGFWLEGATQLEITNSLNYPKIIKYQFDRSKDFRTIDHNTELIVALKSKEICGTDISNRGLLIKKEYFYDNELIFFIDYAYRFDDVGQISEQSLILKWLNENNQVNNLIKDKGFVPFSKNEMRVAVRKRREAVIMILEINIMALLRAGVPAENQNQAMDLGASLLNAVTPEIEKFKNSGIKTDLITRLNQISSTFTFLNNFIAPNVTAIQYISNFLTY